MIEMIAEEEKNASVEEEKTYLQYLVMGAMAMIMMIVDVDAITITMIMIAIVIGAVIQIKME